jgi:hypothetical protein
MSAKVPVENAPAMSGHNVGLLTALAVLLVGIGLTAHGMIAATSAPVHAWLAQGQRAVAQHDHAQAVLAFERARWIAPRASSVRAALASVGAVDPGGAATRAVRLLSSQEWSFLAVGFAWLAALAAGLALGAPPATRGRRGLGRTAIVALAGFALTLGGVTLSNASAPAIVTRDAQPLLVAPYGTAASETSLPAGTMVLTDRSFDDFVKVEAPDGIAGWVPRASLAAVATARAGG